MVISAPSVKTGDKAPDKLVGGANLTYNGEIMADRIIPVVAEVAGQVVKVAVDTGSKVKTGDLLVKIDSSIPEAQRAQAMAGLEAAQSQLDLATTKPTATDLEAAKSAVAAAEAAYNRALKGATDEDKRMAFAPVPAGRRGCQTVSGAVRQDRRQPVRRHDARKPAASAVHAGERSGPGPVRQGAQGRHAGSDRGAYAQLAGARAQLARLEEGAKPAQINAAKAGVKQAETALYLAQLQLDKTTIKSPADGVIYSLDATQGAMTGPGKAVAVIFSPEVKILIPVQESRSEGRPHRPAGEDSRGRIPRSHLRGQGHEHRADL